MKGWATMRTMIASALLMLMTGVAHASWMDANAEGLAGLIVHGDACEITIDDTKMTAFMTAKFDDIAEGMSGINTNANMLRLKYRNKPLTGVDKTITCSGLKLFAEENDLIAK